MSFQIQTTVKGPTFARKNINLILADPHKLMDTHGHLLRCYQLARYFAGYLIDLNIGRTLIMAAFARNSRFCVILTVQT